MININKETTRYQEPKVNDYRIPDDWDSIFLAICINMSRRSKDNSTQCGALLVNKNKRIIGEGFNGPPPNIDDDKIPWNERPQKYAYILHAEENALWAAIESRGLTETTGSTMYCTHHPCTECLLRMIKCNVGSVCIPLATPEYPLSKYQVEPNELLDTQKYPKLEIRRCHHV